jgi:hypothetical protein
MSRSTWGVVALGSLSGAFLLARTLAHVEPGPLPKKYMLAEEVYRERCATCHVALPPEVLPAESWREILSQQGHYGVTLPSMGSIERQLLWLYLRDYSRSLKENEDTPYTLGTSRFFRALHPKVALPAPLSTQSCIQCHAGAKTGDFLVKEAN